MQGAESPLPLTLENLANTCFSFRCVHTFLPSLENRSYKVAVSTYITGWDCKVFASSS